MLVYIVCTSFGFMGGYGRRTVMENTISVHTTQEKADKAIAYYVSVFNRVNQHHSNEVEFWPLRKITDSLYSNEHYPDPHQVAAYKINTENEPLTDEALNLYNSKLDVVSLKYNM